VCNIALDRAIPSTPTSDNRDHRRLHRHRPAEQRTVGAGMLHFALRRAHNIHLQHLDVDKAARAAQKGQKPAVLWFTGLSGAGKSTIANLVEKQLLRWAGTPTCWTATTCATA
jgi:bifunctional enzyme CysN/CysC